MAYPAGIHTARITASLYLFEAALLLTLAGIYKAPIYTGAILFTKAGVALVAGAGGLIASGWLLVRRTRESGSFRRRALALALMTNLLSAFLTFALLEGAVRIVARRTDDEGIVVGSVTLQPTWPELTAQSRKVLDRVTPWGRTSYFIYDHHLGWTVGPNRRSPDGYYYSSLEGIRTGGPDMHLADEAKRYRVALIGDSNAFSLEVPYEESWGYYLQQLLGDEVQVLNFGVDGYGFDQIYLRFQRDVRPWKPQVVVIGFAGHDLFRTMAVYPFISFGWPGYIVKPRFTLEGNEARAINLPLPEVTEILNARDIRQLAFLEYDIGYGTTDWSWRFDHGPLSFRFLTSAFPRWRNPDPRVSKKATIALNSWLVTRIVDSIDQTGGVPLLVSMVSDTTLVPETFRRAQIPFLDATQCLTEVPLDLRKVPSGHHYTGTANRAIAGCTAPAVELALRNGAHRRSASGSLGN